MGDARKHEGILHVDHDQRRPGGVEIVMDVLPPVLGDDAVGDPLGNVELVHRMILEWHWQEAITIPAAR